jgi:hypothetical protein
MKSLDDLVLRHAGASMAKHRALLEAIEGLPCTVDLGRGEARFGDRYQFRVGLLGTEELQDGSWRWSWAETPPLPVEVTAAARELRAYGASHGLELFTEPELDVSEVTGDTIAILGCELTGSEAFFSVTEGNTVLHLVVPSLGGQLPAEHPPRFVAEVMAEILETYDLPDHGAVLSGLLTHEGYRVEKEDPHRWLARHPAGHEVSATFDDLGRLTEIDAREG